MAMLIDNPSFTSNEIYEIQATDPVEGAATGASFSGIGTSNQPHQQLANRTALLKQRQDANISSIAALQSFTGLFTGMMAQNGYVEIPFKDVNRGQIAAIVQWGFYSLVGQPASALKNAAFAVTFPVAFPNACEWAMATWATNYFGGAGAFVSGSVVLEAGALATTGLSVFSDYDGAATINVATSGGGKGLNGFYWGAIGF